MSLIVYSGLYEIAKVMATVKRQNDVISFAETSRLRSHGTDFKSLVVTFSKNVKICWHFLPLNFEWRGTFQLMINN